MTTPSSIHHFRKAFVAFHSKHSFEELKSIADDVVFCSTGLENPDRLHLAIQQVMQNFDPRLDVIVPVGNVVNNFILGAVAIMRATSVLPSILPTESNPVLRTLPIFVAVFKDGKYHVQELELGLNVARSFPNV